MARCAVLARDSGRNEPVEACVGRDSFRRLTLSLGDGDGAARHPYQVMLHFGGILVAYGPSKIGKTWTNGQIYVLIDGRKKGLFAYEH